MQNPQVTEQLAPHEKLRVLQLRSGLQIKQIEALAKTRYGIRVRSSHLSDVLNGKIERPSPNVLAALLLVLGTDLPDTGYNPEDYPVVAAALSAYRSGWHPDRPVRAGRVTEENHTNSLARAA